MSRFGLFLLLILCGASGAFSQSGFVKSGGLPIPGATVTVTQSGQSLSTVTDQDGHYSFPLLAAGKWSVAVDMFGFDTLHADADFANVKGPVNFELVLQQSTAVQRMQQFAARAGAAGSSRGGPGTQADKQFEQQLQGAIQGQQAEITPPSGSQGTNESFLVSGSLSPGLAAGAQADSGPDLRFISGINAVTNGNAPGFGDS
ncbi:MAG: carboxypeptidase regulatory-like domain-containing protein, partial [Acidobacteriaceae bacterium]|nr:carboxypeptidase regulatory-like domain-containing protein [Acidobacteriaceae bacterium]